MDQLKLMVFRPYLSANLHVLLLTSDLIEIAQTKLSFKLTIVIIAAVTLIHLINSFGFVILVAYIQSQQALDNERI